MSETDCDVFMFGDKKVFIHNIKYTKTAAQHDFWGKKCLLCREMFSLGDICQILMVNTDPLIITIVHTHCIDEVGTLEACQKISDMHAEWTKLSGVWGVASQYPV